MLGGCHMVLANEISLCNAMTKHSDMGTGHADNRQTCDMIKRLAIYLNS